MRRVVAAAVAGALVLTGASFVAAGPAVSDPAVTASPPGSEVAVPVTGSAGRPSAVAAPLVSLITGDQVRLLGNRAQLLPARREGVAGSLGTIRMGGHVFVVPASARPYLGRYLDPSLFDVTRLAAAAADQRMALRLTLLPGATPHLPGVVLTDRQGTSASGYLTAASARQFGRALADQWARDARAGWAGRSALFDGVVGIRSAVAPAGPVVHPAFQQVTLTVKLLDPAGRPVRFGFVGLVNVDDGRKYIGFPVINDGLARVSVPLGNYSAITTADSYDDATGSVSSRVVSVTDYAVTHDRQTLVLDSRPATVRPAVRTPRPAGLDALTLEWDRLDRSGHGGLSAGLGYGPGSDVLVAPAPRARVGSLHWLDTWNLSGAPVTGRSYTYDLAYSWDHIVRRQSFVVTASQLATVDSRYYSDGRPHPAVFGRFPVFPFQVFSGGFLLPVATPSVRTEYVLGRGALWWAALLAVAEEDRFAGFFVDGLRRYPPGTHRPAPWLRPALLPGLPEPTGAESSAFCAACRVGDDVVLALAAVTDSMPGHIGFLDGSPDGTPVARMRVFRNGASIFDQTDTTQAFFPASAGPATYRMVLDVDRGAAGFERSTSARTELTFRSARDQGAVAPAGTFCDGPPGATCRVLPLMQVRAPLPVDLNGTMPIGSPTADMTVGHAPGAVATPITAVVVETSTDGSTWHRVRVRRQSAGHYRVFFHHTPAQAGRMVSLRISARDAAGGRLRQTSRRAYAIASS